MSPSERLRRAGVTVPRRGAHRLPTHIASQMVRRDVPMKTVCGSAWPCPPAHHSHLREAGPGSLATNRPAIGPEVHDDRRGLAAVLADLRGAAPRRRLHHATGKRSSCRTSSSISNGAATTSRSRRLPSSGPRPAPRASVRRLSIVRGFLRMVRAAEPGIDVPGPGLVRTSKRPTPRILDPTEIVALMEAARSLGPHGALRPHTVATVIGLLASCGLRASEAIRLDIDDVELFGDVPCLQIRRTKFRKSRLVPFHPTTAAALRTYAEQRRVLGYDGLSSAFFVSERGSRLHYHALAPGRSCSWPAGSGCAAGWHPRRQPAQAAPQLRREPPRRLGAARGRRPRPAPRARRLPRPRQPAEHRTGI